MRLIRFMGCFCFVGMCLSQARALDAPFTIEIASITDNGETNPGAKINVTIKNTSNHQIKLIQSTPLCDYGVRVTNDGGEAVAETSQKRDSRCIGGAVGGAYKVIEIESGAVWEEEIEVDAFATIVRGQSYFVQVARIPDWLGKGIVRSNTIRISVSPQ